MSSNRGWSHKVEDYVGGLGALIGVAIVFSALMYVELVRQRIVVECTSLDALALHFLCFGMGYFGTLFINLLMNLLKFPVQESKRHLGVTNNQVTWNVVLRAYWFLLTSMFGFFAVFSLLYVQGTWLLFLTIMVGTTIASEFTAPSYRRYLIDVGEVTP